VRIDPFPPPVDGDVLPTVFIFANGTFIRKAPLTWDLEKVGSYDFVLPASVIRRGGTRLVFVTDSSLDPAGRGEPTRVGRRFKLWYVLVKPSKPL
jgi:hypothetical protein